ncbi:uncharacterized protein LOC121738255 [Aricia agestis]|uniref:uncharacterized protein LOC121738255 n=1 Tax=Aricia agestis TaxID=91739 RepID=UPI001C201E7B|nr:uncharacterized protein LOC121738255 [Aricia agestis]
MVSYDILWNKMKKAKVPPLFIDLLKFWYRNQMNHVNWAGTLSESYRLECGLRQGGLTSPTLFNLYIDSLIEELSKQHVGCHIDGICLNNLSYADDMALLSPSIGGLRKLLRICEEYACRHGLKYNINKSQYMVFHAAGGRTPKQVPEILLNGIALSRVEEFKYLGHIVTVDLRDDKDIERERRALSKRANMLARRFARCSVEVKLTLFRAFCTSLYTCALWAKYYKKGYNALTVQYNNAFRAMLGLPRYCSASGMFAEARTDGFQATIRKRCASLVRRVRDSSNTVLAMIASRVDCPFVHHCCSMHVTRSA